MQRRSGASCPGRRIVSTPISKLNPAVIECGYRVNTLFSESKKMLEQLTYETKSQHLSGCESGDLGSNQPRQSNTGVLVVVEGPNDIEFLPRISRILHFADPTIPDLNILEEAGRMIFVPFGGGCLHYWSHRMGPLAWPEFHLYDRELPPETKLRIQAARAVNGRVGCRAAITSKRSLENYLSPAAIEDAKLVRVEYSDSDSVADVVAQASLPSHCRWDLLSRRAQRRLRNQTKKWLNTKAVDHMTPARLAGQDPTCEVAGWLRCISSLAGIRRAGMQL